jgi:UDP-2,3-diacylglucosamine hydrolase
VGRSLALICGAGVLPARMAAEARRQGWRVVAFTFDEATVVEAHADIVVPSAISELGPVFGALAREGVTAALFSGKFSLGDVVRATSGDPAAASIVHAAGSRTGSSLADVVVQAFVTMGIEVLDQRAFMGDWVLGPGCWTARPPADDEWTDVWRGLDVARTCARAGIGQTVVLRHGVVTAVEAIEGTSAAIRRGAELAGPGAVVVKAVARANDYRFDTPAIGAETIEVAAAGGVGVVAVEAGRVQLVDREAALGLADRASVAVVGLTGE